MQRKSFLTGANDFAKKDSVIFRDRRGIPDSITFVLAIMWLFIAGLIGFV